MRHVDAGIDFNQDYHGGTDRVVRSGQVPVCSSCGQKMFPADDHGRFACICDLTRRTAPPKAKSNKVPDYIDFPLWLVGVCETDAGFDEARHILVYKHGFVPSPAEEDRIDRALVMPRPGIDLVERLKSDNYDVRGWGWGLGRARLDRDYCETRGGPSFEFKYFAGEVPWDVIAANPMKPAMVEVINLLRPKRFLGLDLRDHSLPEINNPYSG